MKAITILDNEEYLRQISTEVVFPDADLENDLKVLSEYCKENDVLAMASVQLGIPKRIIYLKNTNLEIIDKMQKNLQTEEEDNFDEARILINPVIIKKEGLTRYWEACASCLDNMGLVERSYRILVRYQDRLGSFHEDLFEGFESTVLSHEMDHLDGILHMDIALEIKNMPREERMIFRQTHGYEILSKTSKWEENQNKKRIRR